MYTCIKNEHFSVEIKKKHKLNWNICFIKCCKRKLLSAAAFLTVPDMFKDVY